MKTGFVCPNGKTQNVEAFHHRSVVPRETEDAVVIGAGVVGIAVARELATKMTLMRSLCRSIPRRSQYLFSAGDAGAAVNRHICHLHLSSSSLPAPSPSRNPSTHTRMHGTRIANDGGSRSYEDGTGISVRESSALAGLWDCRQSFVYVIVIRLFSHVKSKLCGHLGTLLSVLIC